MVRSVEIGVQTADHDEEELEISAGDIDDEEETANHDKTADHDEEDIEIKTMKISAGDSNIEEEITCNISHDTVAVMALPLAVMEKKTRKYLKSAQRKLIQCSKRWRRATWKIKRNINNQITYRRKQCEKKLFDPEFAVGEQIDVKNICPVYNCKLAPRLKGPFDSMS